MRGEKVFLLFVIGIFIINFTSAVCTVTLDKSTYIAGETATASMTCSEATEKSDAYILNWTNSSSAFFEADTGITPATVGQLFYQSFSIPSTWPSGVYINATLVGSDNTDLEGTDFANVTAFGEGGTNILEITNTTFGGGYLGLVSSVKATVKDENNKKISGGLCEISGLSNDESKVLLKASTIPINGIIEASDILPPTRFNEGTDYSYSIKCYCGSSGSATECINEDGNSVNNSIGSAKNFFTTKQYLNVNTVTDKTNYDLRDYITVCVNVTNIDYPERIPLEIDYQTRCSVGEDNNYDTDRSLLFSDGQSYDKRGINVNTTQMQCKRFIIPEIREHEGTQSSCYSSSNVWIISEDGERLLDYPTTSSLFYINSTELNLKVDWQQTSNLTFNSIVNLSSDSFKSWNGSNTGNIDIQLISPNEAADPNIKSIIQSINLNNFLISKYINTITVTNLTSASITPYLEFTDEGNLEIELRDQYLGKTSWYNITITFNNYEERQASALEGISNKTGTFHLDVNCPSVVDKGTNMNCSITAQVEDSQLVEKEVDFTCYVYDGISEYSSLNFNQMINRTSITLYREFLVPSSFSDGTQYILQCHADYYNLGSRRDSFYDTFLTSGTAPTSSSGSSSSRYGDGGVVANESSGKITGFAVADNETPNIEFKWKDIPFLPETKSEVAASVFMIFVVLSILFILLRQKRKFDPHFKFSSLRLILGIIIFLIVLLGIGILIYDFFIQKFLNSGLMTYSYIQDPLFRGIIFTSFIIISIIVLFKTLNIRMEIKLGDDFHILKNHEDRKAAKLQKKINQEILRRELNHVKHGKK